MMLDLFIASVCENLRNLWIIFICREKFKTIDYPQISQINADENQIWHVHHGSQHIPPA